MVELKDTLVRGLAAGGMIRIAAARTSNLTAELARRHDAGPAAAVALSRVATATALLASGLKGRQQTGIQINGDGPLREIYAVCDAEGHIRATVANPKADIELDLSDGIKLAPAIGAGRLSVTKKLSEDAPAYRGMVPLVTGEVAEDLVHYFFQSEQIPTAAAVSEVLGPDGLTASGGFLVQAMPGATDEILIALEKRVLALPPLATLLADGETPTQILERLVDDLEIMLTIPITHQCNCERERYARILVSLGEKELTEMAESQETTELECHFCRTVYTFDTAQMRALALGGRMHEAKLAQLTAEAEAK